MCIKNVLIEWITKSCIWDIYTNNSRKNKLQYVGGVVETQIIKAIQNYLKENKKWTKTSYCNIFGR